MGDQIRRAWIDFVQAECTAGPLVIVLEDLHWGDPATVELLDKTLGLLAEQPLAVIAMARPEVDELFPNLWAKRSPQAVRLGGLSRNASERLARDVLGKDVAADTVRGVVELAAGNAFYLEELLRAVAEGRDGALPPNVIAMAQARIEGLDADQRKLLRAASVFGRTFWWGGVEALARVPAGVERLEELVRAEIVAARPTSKLFGESELAFRHALVREAAYAMLTDEDRKLGHKLAAEWLERAGETDPMTLAEHHERGGQGASAAAWYQRAAAEALSGNDYAGALARARRGMACGPSEEVRPRLELSLAEAHRARGENALAYAHARAAMAGLEPGKPAWCAAALEAGSSAGNLGDLAAVQELAELLHPKNARGPLSQEALVAGANVAAERLVTTADPEMLNAIVAATGPDDKAAQAHVHHALAAAAYLNGELVEYLDGMKTAMEAFARIGDMRSHARAMVNFGAGWTLLGEWERAEATCREALAIADPLGLGFVSALARNNIGLPLVRLGRIDEGLRHLELSAEAFRTQQHTRLLAGTYEIMAMALLAKGDLATAEVQAKVAVDLATLPGTLLRPLAVLAMVRLERGDAAGALVAAEAANAQRGADARGLNDAILRLAYGEALAANGQAEAARVILALGRDGLLARAAKISDAERRQTFLTRIPEHARLLRLAAELPAEK
jgi:tetratricopeptide (TPR) repeat protein